MKPFPHEKEEDEEDEENGRHPGNEQELLNDHLPFPVREPVLQTCKDAHNENDVNVVRDPSFGGLLTPDERIIRLYDGGYLIDIQVEIIILEIGGADPEVCLPDPEGIQIPCE